MKDLLELAKKELQQPLKDARRKLIIILNIVFVVLVVIYLCFDKITTGSFVPDSTLYLVYIVPFIVNLASLLYNLKYLQMEKHGFKRIDNKIDLLLFKNYLKIDNIIGWASILPVLAMSFCNMTGVGNPSNDAILTDYALANSLIIGTLVIVGRKAALVWFVIVMTVLFWDVSRLGWDYQYHYLTPTEVEKYKQGLKNNEPSALLRKHQLEKSGLNPPKITRYFSAWFVFIIVTFMATYFFSGISIDMFKIVPKVVSNIEKAVEENQKVKSELESKQKEVANSSLRILKYNEIISSLKEEIDQIGFQERKKLQKIIDVIGKALNEEEDWDKFQSTFNVAQGDFFTFLQNNYPDLSKSEMRHLAYIRMKLPSSQIAKMLDVKMETLRTLRHRLKKKLNLSHEIDLVQFTENL